LASDESQQQITIPILLWRRLILELKKSGQGGSESGAFLLARQSSTTDRVTAFICYDHLDPNAYQGGAIAFHAIGHAALWEHCRKRELRVVGDVHTHPGRGIGQSGIDQRNPMIPLQGHVAIILPNFGRTRWWTLDDVGVYEYLGDFKWRTHGAIRYKSRVILCLW
jgi:proteasome lid subunit RPN8/RPN11